MFPVDLSNILPLKKGAEERRPLSLGTFSLEVVISRDQSGIYHLWVYDKNRSGNDHKGYRRDNIADEAMTEFIWKAFLQKTKTFFNV
ncbi:MAG: hypothetical protein O7D34_10320 [Ignavibacteria bacterium]|nr:hypothetical protein [Ignavibacteria bacterium]